MQSVDDLFYREFNQMMSQLKSLNGNISLSELPLSDELANRCRVLNHSQVYLQNITDEVFASLNGSIAILWSRPNLKRRKFDSKGEFIKKDGDFVYEEVDVPHDCLAIVSDVCVNVKTKYKSSERMIYVDYITQQSGNSDLRKYIYIVPRKYCFKVSQTALVASLNKMTRAFYSGVSVALQNGSTLFMYVIPFKASSVDRAYRVLATGTNPEELFTLANDIYRYWIEKSYAFNPNECEVLECTRGRTNLAFEVFPGKLDLYTPYSDKSMDINDENIEDLIFSESSE